MNSAVPGNAYHVFMAKKFAWIGLIVLLTLGAGFLGEILGFFRGVSRVGTHAAEAMANAVYRDAIQGRYEDIVTDKLAVSDVAESLRKAQRDRGPIRRWKVVRSRSNMLGIPILVEVEVERHKTQLELLIIHAPFRFHDHSIIESSIIGNAKS
jgi:hypothetical protein